MKAGKPITPDDMEITVNFPDILEGDLAGMITATSTAMTLGNRGGQIVGIDEKAGVLKLMQLEGIENAEELVDEMYPPTGNNKYDPNRTIEDAASLQPPLATKPPYSPGGPQAPGGHPQSAPREQSPTATPGQEALIRNGWTQEGLLALAERKRRN